MIYLCLILAFFIQLPSAQQAGSAGVSVGDQVTINGHAACVISVDGKNLFLRYAADGFSRFWSIDWGMPVLVPAAGDCRSIFTTTTTTVPPRICADGYERVSYGEINGKGGRQVCYYSLYNNMVSSCNSCANICDSEPSCNSYECDTVDEFGAKRQLFCAKQTPAEMMYKALKGCSRNRFHAFQEEVGFYDPSRSVAKIQCCSLDGSTCTRKDSWPHGACLGDREKVTWAQAKQICEAEGMRLCNSQQEVDNCCHRGCGYDGALTWTGIYPGVGSHYAACGRPGRCNAASIVSEDIAFQKVRCVSDSRRPGWFSRPNLCGNISWESDIWGGCHSLTFQAATEFCASQDARLPTREEAESGCAAASGCGFDAQYIWTSTSA